MPTSPPESLPPLMRLATELHLAIISYLPDLKDSLHEGDLALLQLRRTNRYFRSLVPPPTHNDLLRLEFPLYKYSAFACKFCLRLRPNTKFASTMLKDKTGFNGTHREKRFCADCGFDTTVVGQSQRYSPSSRVCVNGVDWVWCKSCKLVRKGEEAKSVCVGLCKACYGMLGCMCRARCGRPQHSTKVLQPPRSMWPEPEARPRRVMDFYRWIEGSGLDSYEEEQIEEEDFCEEQMHKVQMEDDDWRGP